MWVYPNLALNLYFGGGGGDSIGSINVGEVPLSQMKFKKENRELDSGGKGGKINYNQANPVWQL